MAEPASEMTLEQYEFPHNRLRRQIIHADRTPLVLIACGSFSPITFLHLRMFEMAADYARFNTEYEVVGAYLSCVGDAYKKTGLVKAAHRINMCSLAVQQSTWISVDPWEALHTEYLETAKVLDHFQYEINEVLGGVETPVGKKKCRIALLAGADLIQTMSTPGVWADKDIDYILRNFGAFIVEVGSNTNLKGIIDVTLTPWFNSGPAPILMRLFQRYRRGRITSPSFNNLFRTTSVRLRFDYSFVATCPFVISSQSRWWITLRRITYTKMTVPEARPAIRERKGGPEKARTRQLRLGQVRRLE
jgi:nicotinate (nicotinamide) nucleotide adenylyltransferase